MKKLLILFIILSLTIACSKDDNNSNNNPTTTSGLSVKINGVLWEGSILGNMLDESSEQFVVNSLNQKSNEVFGFTMDYYDGPGAYPKSKDNLAFVTYARIDKNIFLNVSGTAFVVNVTNVETVAGVKKVHGNFSGTLKSVAGEVLQFTEGKF